MSFGEHLEELRTCLIRALIGVAIASVLGFFLANRVLGYIIRPLMKAQHAEGLPPSLQALSPTEMFTTYLKAAIGIGLVIAMPWVLYQIWRFVSVGLYLREQRFVRSLFASSIALFAVGVLFLYFLVLPIMLQFLIAFNRTFELPDFTQPIVQKAPSEEPAQHPPAADPRVGAMKIPTCSAAAGNSADGEICVDPDSQRLLVKTKNGLLSAPLVKGPSGNVVQSQFAVQEYMSFVLMLALAFGLTFETPIVVYFLAWAGIVKASDMAAARRYVILAAAILSAVLTPTSDVLSQLLLAVPMYGLFELGLLMARSTERRKSMGAA